MSQSQSSPIMQPDPAMEALPSHVQWLVANRGPALASMLGADTGAGMSSGQAVQYVCESDPSPHKHATQWLVDTLLAGGYHWEDLVGGMDSKVAETLGLFAQHRGALPRGQRNLEDHTSLASVYRAISHLVRVTEHDATPTGRRLRRIERERARQESIIIHESPEFRLVVPTTAFAAQWWGRGTRWCTAAERNNMFDRYNQEAPLVIAILPTTRYQMWIDADGDMQFMDEVDAQVSLKAIAEHREVLQPLLEWACSRGANGAILLVDPSRLTPRMCQASVELDGYTLRFVPDRLKTKGMCMAALESVADVIAYVPPEYIDVDMAAQAVSRSPSVIGSIPTHLLCRQVYLASMSQPVYLTAVPQEYLDHDFYMEAIRINYRCIQRVPENMVCDAMHMAAVEVYPNYVFNNTVEPGPLLERLQVRAVQLDSTVLAILLRISGSEPVSQVVLDAAITAWPQNLGLIPWEMRTPERCRAAVEADGNCLASVTFKYIDQDMCWQAVRSNPHSLRHVPYEYKTPELCLYALEKDKQEEFNPRTKSLAINNPGLLRYVPEELRTHEVCLTAVRSNPYSLRSVPEHVADHAIYAAAVELMPRCVYRIPDIHKTRAIMDIVAQSYPALAHDVCPRDMKEFYPEHTPGPELPAWSPDYLDDLVARVEAWSAERAGCAIDTGIGADVEVEAPLAAGVP